MVCVEKDYANENPLTDAQWLRLLQDHNFTDSAFISRRLAEQSETQHPVHNIMLSIPDLTRLAILPPQHTELEAQLSMEREKTCGSSIRYSRFLDTFFVVPIRR